MRMASTGLFLAAVWLCDTFLAGQPVPPAIDARAVERRIEDIRRRLEQNVATAPQPKELAAFADKYLTEAARALRSGKTTEARQLADAADACRRPMDHLEHIATGKVPPAPPGRGGRAGSEGSPEDRLRQIYFRLRLCDYFLQQIPPPAPTRLLELARGFYEQAERAQHNSSAIADEYAKACDDLTHALESLAQAALP
jgi:hypothetical protein